MNTFTFTFNPDKLMIESLQEGFNKWISKIERDKELYEVSIVPGNFHHPFYGRLVVKYKNRVLFYIDFYWLMAWTVKMIKNNQIPIYAIWPLLFLLSVICVGTMLAVKMFLHK